MSWWQPIVGAAGALFVFFVVIPVLTFMSDPFANRRTRKRDRTIHHEEESND